MKINNFDSEIRRHMLDITSISFQQNLLIQIDL